MKITDLTVTLFSWDDIPATSYGAHTGKLSNATKLGLVAIATDAGVTGHAFLGSALYPADMDAPSLIRALKPVVVGENPLNRERINQRLWKRGRTTTARAIGAVDVALWDLAGKVANLPVWQLLGGFRDRIPAYASSQVLANAQAYAEEAVQFRDAGWAAYKIHPRQVWKEDIATCEAVRKAVGPDYTLMLDSTWAYQYDVALRVGLAIQDLAFHWYEDPLADQDIYNYVKLRDKLSIPLMATEYPAGGLEQYAQWITEKATDYLRGDVAVKGGITTLVKTAHLAEAFGMNYEIHHGGNSLNNVANLHVAMAIRNTEFFEVLLPDAAQKYGLVEDIAIGRDGFVAAPKGPGLGAQIDFELVKRKTVAVLS